MRQLMAISKMALELLENCEKLGTPQDKKKILRKIKSNPLLENIVLAVEALQNTNLKPNEVDAYIQTVKESIRHCNFTPLHEAAKKAVNRYKFNKLDAAIGIVLFENDTISNISAKQKARRVISEHLTSLYRLEESVKHKNTLLAEQFTSLDDSDVKFIAEYSNASEVDRIRIFETVKQECISKVRSLMETTGDDASLIACYKTLDGIQTTRNHHNEQNLTELYQLLKQMKSNEK